MIAGSDGEELIEAYLDELLLGLRGHPRQVRSMLAETEYHLRDAMTTGVAGGMTAEDAARDAVKRFGSAQTVAQGCNRGHHRLPGVTVWRQLVLAFGWLGGVGLVAIGVSGGVAAVMYAAWGARFVGGDLPGVTYTPARCADFLSYYPHAGTCTQAAALHHASEVVSYRLAAGLLGLLALAVVALLRRRWRTSGTVGVLPSGFSATVGATVFGVAGLVLVGQGVDYIVLSPRAGGAGNALSGGLVALVVAAGFAVSLLNALSSRQPAELRSADG